MLAAYDLDGVLCDAFAPSNPMAWRRMHKAERDQRKVERKLFFQQARQLHAPNELRFHVITARKEAEAGELTRGWLDLHFPHRVLQLHMLTVGRTIENVVRFKAEVLLRIGATDFTEDNRQVVVALRRAVPRCRIWHFKKGRSILDYEAPL